MHFVLKLLALCTQYGLYLLLDVKQSDPFSNAKIAVLFVIPNL